MAKNKQSETPTTKAKLQDQLGFRLQEGAFIGFAVVCIGFFIALASFSQHDPGWSQTGGGEPVKNLMGALGAWLADVFFALFGYMAFLFPVLLAVRAWGLFNEQRQEQAKPHVHWGLRVLGFTLIITGATALVVVNGIAADELPFGAGGALGASLGDLARDVLNPFGARLLLVAGILFGVTLFADVSWLKVMDTVGAKVLFVFDWFGLKIAVFLERRRDKKRIELKRAERKIELEREFEKVAARPAPKIEKVQPKVEVADRVVQEKQVNLFDDLGPKGLPPLELLNVPENVGQSGYSKEALEALSRLLEIKLKDFAVDAEVVAVYPGPVITRFEIQPAAGVKVSKVSGLAKDLARSLAVISVRIVEVIPGKSVIGVEIPNENRESVLLSQVLSSKVYDDAKSAITMALGHDISGAPVTADLGKMPHLLVAGTTGSGKSVGVNAMLMSILYKATPEEVRLIMVDPKMLELSVYDGIPHLLTPVITDMKDAANGLRWCVGEMERRYKLMAALGVRNLGGFNRKVVEARERGTPILDPLWQPEEQMVIFDQAAEPPTAPELEPLPFIVVVIDEFADMMMIVGKKVEELIARIAQKARAAGIHLILATQRPSVDVITGLIKANIPTRIAFQVSSKVDSRTILDQGGAEQLLGQGDMLYMPPGTSLPVRVHGAFVDDDEVHRVVACWKSQSEPNYLEDLLSDGATEAVPGFAPEGGEGGDDPEADALYDEAVAFVTKSRKASISAVQRSLRIGYNRAARMVETMEAAGVVSAAGHNGQREVLAPPPPEN